MLVLERKTVTVFIDGQRGAVVEKQTATVVGRDMQTVTVVEIQTDRVS